jgi:hypothetical protein
MRRYALVERLPQMQERLKELEKRLEELEQGPEAKSKRDRA